VDTLFGQCVRILSASTNVVSVGENIRLLLELMIKLRGFPSSCRWRLHRSILTRLVQRVWQFALHDNAMKPNVGHMRSVHLYVPVLFDSVYFRRTIADINSRLSHAEERLLHT
jgi:hypothetical protein